MVSVGWAVFNAVEGSVTLPNFNEYNACGEVRRSNNAERQQRYRDKIKAEKEAELRNVTRNVTNNDREEKNREEKKDKDPQPPRGMGKILILILSNCLNGYRWKYGASGENFALSWVNQLKPNERRWQQ